MAKNNYSEKLKRELSANDPASWTGLRNIKYKTPPPQSVENQQLADDLNVFYCPFEKARLKPSTRSDLHFTHSPRHETITGFKVHRCLESHGFKTTKHFRYTVSAVCSVFLHVVKDGKCRTPSVVCSEE